MNHFERAEQTSNAPTQRVLVVDDVEANRSVLCRRLSRLGYVVSAAEGGMSALAMIEAESPDIVLLDYMMPDMNGIDVLRDLRANGRYADLPVVMLTARAEAGTVVASLEAGADDYVSKPIDFDVLAARIEAQLQRRRHANHLKRANAALDERVTRRSLEMSNLQDQLETEQAKRRALQAELERLNRDRAAVFPGEDIADRLSPQLQRIVHIADVLASDGAAVGNPAALAEIAALARAALKTVKPEV